MPMADYMYCGHISESWMKKIKILLLFVWLNAKKKILIYYQGQE